MGDDPWVRALIARADAGDPSAWNEIVERYAPLVWSICARYGLDREDIDDVGQSVWLLLVEKLGTLREPAALPGWLATTTRRECIRVIRAAQRHAHAELPPEGQMPSDSGPEIEQAIFAAERDAAVRAAFAELPRRCREMLSMMVSDPPRRYEDISAELGVAMGSIGPMRRRCLTLMRRSPHLRGIAEGDTGDEQPGKDRDG
jgi:RNA polymerase sigma factor (sigma-70 family)